MTIEQAITEAVAIKRQIDELKSRYTDLQTEIIARVQVPDGKRTGYVDSGNVRARVQIMEKYKWDQDKLKAFTFEWKPVDKKTIDSFLSKYATPEQKALITDAMTVEKRTFLSLTEVTA